MSAENGYRLTMGVVSLKFLATLGGFPGGGTCPGIWGGVPSLPNASALDYCFLQCLGMVGLGTWRVCSSSAFIPSPNLAAFCGWVGA